MGNPGGSASDPLACLLLNLPMGGVYNAHHFSEERSLKGVLFPGSFTVSLVERGEGA
jgi:hypothetical protein